MNPQTTTTPPSLPPILAAVQPSQVPAPRAHSALSLWCVRHRWVVLVLSVLTLAGGLILLANGGISIATNESELVGDSAAAERAMADVDWGDAPTEAIVVTVREGMLNPADAAALSGQLRTTLEGTPGTDAVSPPVPGVDGRSLVTQVALTEVQPGQTEVAPLVDRVAQFRANHPELEVGQVGEASADAAISDLVSEDFVQAEYSAIPLTLVILLIAFGSVAAAGIPVILAMGSVGVALGVTAWWSREIFPVTQTAQSLLLLIGLAVGVDYALFIMRRAREERAAGASVSDSIALAGATAGRAVVVSGLTVMVALAGMVLAGGLFRSLAVGAIIVVGAAVVASATTLPALLGVLGDRVDALRMPWRRRPPRHTPEQGRWGRLAFVVTRRPVLWIVLTGGVLVGLALPALGMRTALSGVESLPPDLTYVRSYHQLQRAMPTQGTHLTLVVQAPAADRDAVTRVLTEAVPALAQMDQVTGVAPEPVVSPDGSLQYLAVGVDVTPSDERLPGVVAQLRKQEVPQLREALTAAGVAGVQVHIGGEAATTDLDAWMDSRLPSVVGFVLALTFLVMLVSFGSPSLAAATIMLNALSVGAAYGVVALVFENTWAEQLLDFTSTGTVASWLPTLLFVVLFGLSMDYHVFVVSRVREAYAAGATPGEAIRRGVARSAGVVTAAAAVMVGVFSIFGTLSLAEFKQMGVGLAVAVLLDATLVRGILLPATLALLGRRAHTGPRWLPTIRH